MCLFLLFFLFSFSYFSFRVCRVYVVFVVFLFLDSGFDFWFSSLFFQTSRCQQFDSSEKKCEVQPCRLKPLVPQHIKQCTLDLYSPQLCLLKNILFNPRIPWLKNCPLWHIPIMYYILWGKTFVQSKHRYAFCNNPPKYKSFPVHPKD